MDRKYAIIDMDGTMVSSMHYWDQLGEEYFRSRGITDDLTEVLELARPMTIPETAELFVRYFSLPDDPEQICADLCAMMEAHYRNDIPAKPGVAAYLQMLQEQGVTLCVVSSTTEYLVRICLQRLGFDKYFDFILSCESVGSGKHRPDAYFAAAEKMGAAPEEIAVYEDAVYAVQTALKAGFYVVGVYDEPSKAMWPEIQAIAHETVSFE